MADCYFIGIGGTGSKCVNNYVYSSAAGIGPDRLWIGMVDQDDANGNVAESRSNIENYQRVRRILRTPGLSDINDKTDLFKTNITTQVGQTSWCPLPGTAPTLKDVFSYDLLNKDLQDTIDCLYHPQEELNLELDEGFRARPSIGAAAILSRVQENDPFWINIFNAIDSAKAGTEVRIFLVSSIFGGTGASGFPSIARLIRSEMDKRGIRDGVHLGGALMLPYFKFPKPGEDEIKEVAYAESFLEQSRGALDYYHRLFEKEQRKTFDQLYLVGWDPLIELPVFEKGGNLQRNPALLPELFTSLAASRFFMSNSLDNGIFHIARNDANAFSWDDFPEINDQQKIVKDNLSQMTRTALAYREIYYPYLVDQWRKVKNESWFRNTLLKQGVDFNNDETSLNFNNLLAYFENYLDWLANMIHFSQNATVQGIDLVDVNMFSQYENSQVTISDKVRDHQLKQFNSLISGVNSSSLAKVFLKMNYSRVPKNRTGIGAFVGALYESCKS